MVCENVILKSFTSRFDTPRKRNKWQGCVKGIHRFDKLGHVNRNEWIVARMQGGASNKETEKVDDNRLKVTKTCGRCNFDNVPSRFGREPSDKGKLIGKWVRIVADPVATRMGGEFRSIEFF